MVVDSHSFGADMFMCADMLVDTPVTPPTTADTPLAWPASRQLLHQAAVVEGEFCLCYRDIYEAQR